MITLDRYGLHWIEGDIGLLVQANKVDHVLGVNMEFEVKVKRSHQRLYCPHNINLDEAAEWELPDDELVRAMLPVPKPFGERILFVQQTPENSAYVNTLLRLSSSNQMMPIWGMRPDMAAHQLSITNVAPLVIFGSPDYQALIMNRVIDIALHSPRRLILLGPKSAFLRSEVQRIDVDVHDLSGISLEQAGAWHLKQRMLGHVNGSWNETPDRQAKS